MEEEITVERAGAELSGTPRRVAASGGVVLFLHGSGPMDRDQNGAGAALNVFNILAEDVAGAGFASLRYDKRGVGASGGNYARVRQADLVADAAA